MAMTAVDADTFDHEVAELIRCTRHVDDPFPFFTQLRSSNPIYWCRELSLWIITGYPETVEFLRNPAVSREERNSSRYDPTDRRSGPVWDLIDTWLMWRDPPDHARIRRAMTKMFAVRSVEAIRPAVERTVSDLLEPLVEPGSMDFLNDFAIHVPRQVLFDMLGVPTGLQQTVEGFIAGVIRTLAPTSTADDAAEAAKDIDRLKDYVKEIVEDRRRNPREEDLVSVLANDPERLSEDEMFGNVIFMVAAGASSAGYTLANGLFGMLRRPGQYELLRSDPSLIPSAVEEMLRWDGSNRNAAGRWPKEDIVIDGTTIPAGDEVWCVLAAADHDPREFDNPETFDARRAHNPHLAFGFGRHACIGAHLARVEMQAALTSMVQKLPDLHLAADEFEWHRNWLVRHRTSLPVAWSVGSNLSA